MKKLILIGGGGHCKSCIDVIESTGNWKISGIIEKENNTSKNVLGYPIIGCDDNIPKFVTPDNHFLITIGQIGLPTLRIRLFQFLKDLNANIATIVSPLSYVSKHASIKEGSIVMHHALVNANAQIGANCIINTKVLIEHDAIVEDHCHIATGAIINGGVKVKNSSFVGTGVVTKQYSEIEAKSFIKANTFFK